MIKNYTQDAKQRCLNLVDSDIEDIWKSIEQVPADTEADKWKKKIESLAKEYILSSRFALMRIFLNRASESQLIDKNNPVRGFKAVMSDDTECILENITIEHAAQITDEEIAQFEKLLMYEASRQSDFDELKCSDIIKKALFPVQKKTTLLNRDEAFQLGHCLRFRLQEMEWFLLRVFDCENGFSYNTSNDLIEAYGFLSDSSSKKVETLKNQFSQIYGGIQKADFEEKAVDWTMDAGASLPEKVRYWSIHDKSNQDSLFLKWLGDKASFLDLPSKAAVYVYRNLAVFAHNLATQTEEAPEVDVKKLRKGHYETDFVRCVREIVQMKDYADQTLDALFENGNIAPQKCSRVANTLLLENLNFSFSEQTDKTKAWHIIQVMTNGNMTVSGGINKSRERVKDILSGNIARIEKSDMLYLLWFTANLCWFDGKSCPEPEEIANRLNDFIDTSELCLDAAELPEFYPPHLIEQSMMLSIVYAFGGPDKCDPAETYESICSSLISHRSHHKNTKRN